MNQQHELDLHFQPIAVAAEAVVSRLQKARWRALTGDRYGLIRERRKEGRPVVQGPGRPSVFERAGSSYPAVSRIRLL